MNPLNGPVPETPSATTKSHRRVFSTDRRYEGTSYVAADHSTTPQNYAASGNGRVNILRRRISGGERIRTSIRDRTQRNPLSHPIYRAAQLARRCLGCNTGADDYHITLRMCNPRHTRFQSSQPVPPFLPFPTFFLSLLACAVFRNRYVQL